MAKVVGIKFGDNDFGLTLSAFIRLLAENSRSEGQIPETKVKIVELFNRSAPGIYWVAQNRLQYNPNWDPSTYLQIGEEDVYVDDEVDEFINSDRVGTCNMDFYVVDLRGNEPYFYTL